MNTTSRSMRAWVKERAEAGFSLKEMPVPEIGPRDVLIQVTKAGICGTDVHIHKWDRWAASRVPTGVIVGHEFVGQVVEIGDAVESMAVGDRVSGEGHVGCGFCYCCRTGQGHICSRVDILGIDIHGCFADFVKLPDTNVWKVHPAIPDGVAAMFDPMGNAMHTLMMNNIAGSSVLVVGVGPIGLMAVNMARAAGARLVVALDINNDRLSVAQELGAHAALRPDAPNVVQQVMDMTREGQGADVMIEASGSAPGIKTGFQMLRSGGWVALLGIPSDEVCFDLATDVIFKGITMYGINGRRMYETWYQVEDMLLAGALRMERVITHELPFEDLEEGMALLTQGKAIKVLLDVASPSR